MTEQVFGIIIQIVVLIIAGVVGVNAIKTTTAVLNETIKSLKLTIDQLRTTIHDIQLQQADHKAKIAVLESKGST